MELRIQICVLTALLESPDAAAQGPAGDSAEVWRKVTWRWAGVENRGRKARQGGHCCPEERLRKAKKGTMTKPRGSPNSRDPSKVKRTGFGAIDMILRL